MFEDWILTEDIDILVTTTEPELLVTRVFGPGAVLLRMNSEMIISANGEIVDFGDDGPGYWGIFDHVIEAASVENGLKVGFHCEMTEDPENGVGFYTRQAVRSAASALMSVDDLWQPRDADNITVNADGTWCSPGTFDSIYGSWIINEGRMFVDINQDEEAPKQEI